MFNNCLGNVDQMKDDETGGSCSTHGGASILVRNPETKGPLERPRRRWEDNIKVDVKGTEWEGMD
jgi:hypothetical protein